VVLPKPTLVREKVIGKEEVVIKHLEDVWKNPTVRQFYTDKFK